jgi:cell division protein FtsB
MEFFPISFIFFQKSKKIKSILFLFNLIVSSNLLTLELNRISIPYLSLHDNIPGEKLRKLSEQYIYGSVVKLNYYYSNLYLGNDMQKQGYILDTGSTITTSTCSPLCQHCGKHISPAYNIKTDDKIISCNDKKCRLVTSKCNGSTYQCSFSISYSEGSSLSGVYINEIVRFGENYREQNGTFVPIGCTTDENHLFYTQDANGIMGLANNDRNFIEILYTFGAIKANIFSLCFAQLGGVFNIGEINNKTHKENVTFVPMLLDRGKYFGLTIKSMAVNNYTIENYNRWGYNIFIDSGTTISYINVKIFDEILKIMNEECNKFEKKNACGKYSYHSDFGHCFYFNSVNDLDYAVYNYWPIFHFYLDGYDYEWKAENYVFNISTKSHPGACMGINKSYGTKITLGSSWMIGHDIIFDRDKRLIGIAEAECYQNKIINESNGLELNDEIIDEIIYKNDNNSYVNETRRKKYIIKKYSRNKILDIILIICIIILFLMLILIVVLAIKYSKQKEIEKLETKNNNNKNDYSKNNKDYLNVTINNMKENKIDNTLDFI